MEMESLRIAIDVQPLYSSHNNRGIGRYVVDLLRALFMLDKSNTYYLINFYGDEPCLQRLEAGGNVHELNFYEESRCFLLDSGTIESRNFFCDLTKDIIDAYQIDIFHVMAAVDQYDVYDVALCFEKTRFVTTLYDLIPLIFGKQYLSGGTYSVKYAKCLEQYVLADGVISDSQSAKDDAVSYLKTDAEKVKVVYAGVNEFFQKKNYEDESVLKIKVRYGISKPYVVCVGADDFRKNLRSLVAAFSSLRDVLKQRYQLVIICSIGENTKNSLLEMARKYGSENELILTGYIPDDDMLCLLNNAHLAAFPSMYEGFGLPVVEAWKCEIPVLTSNNSSLGEIAGEAVVQVDPFSVESIRDGLKFALMDADLDKYKLLGMEKVKAYTWGNVAKSVLELYNEVHAAPKKKCSAADLIHIREHILTKCLQEYPAKKRIFLKTVYLLKTTQQTVWLYKLLKRIFSK